MNPITQAMIKSAVDADPSISKNHRQKILGSLQNEATSAQAPAENLLSIREFASRLKVCERTVHYWLKEQKLIPIRHGRLIRLRESDLLRGSTR